MSEVRQRPDGETLLFPCAGAAHCGRVAYQTALQMTTEGQGKVFCLAAVSAGIEDKLNRTRRAARRVAIDGCEDRCSCATLERAGLPVDARVVLTDLGIDKQPERSTVLADTCTAVKHLRVLLGD